MNHKQSKQLFWFLFISFGLVLMFTLYLFVTHMNPHTLPSTTQIKWESIPTKDIIKNGEFQFKVRCSSCHGMNGEGSPYGPQLSDASWIHGTGTHNEIYSIIRNGIPNTEMKGWGYKLRDDDIQALTYYVLDLNKQ